MNEEKKGSGQLVMPGERLGVIEEFTPGPGTYTEQGVVYSKIVGCALLDMLNKKVSVYPLTHTANVPRMGSIVTGQVSDVQSKRATLRILKIGERNLTGFFSGVLHISEASPRYVETMFDVCKTGDIMRAKVISEKNRTYQLSTADSDLGVMLAFCSACGHALTLTKQNMQCSKCGKIEMRKAVSDYEKLNAVE
jgi:exosome complex component CSL4